MLSFMQEFWLQTVFAMCVSVLTFFVKRLYVKSQAETTERQTKVEKESAEQKLLKAGVLALLHDRIYKCCQSHIHAGRVTVHDMDSLSWLYASYHALGGNGTAKTLYEKVQKLPIRTGEH